MIRNLTLITSLLTLFIAGASAQRRHAFRPIPTHAVPAGISVTELQKKMHGILRAAHSTTGAMLKTTSGGERLIAQAMYDYSRVPGGQLDDSVFLTYSGNRTSAFDFDYLQYDGGNESDAPGVFNGTGYVHFDTGYGYSSTGPYGNAIRSYNANGKVVRSEFEDQLEQLFTYNAQGRLARKLLIGYNSTSGTFTDSNSRNFYTYNAAGHVLIDSSEYWDVSSSAWEPDMTIKYTPNAAGYPVQVAFTGVFGTVPVLFKQYNFVYNATNMPVLITTKYDDGNGNLVDSYKDSLGYTVNMRVWNRRYEWDMTASAWHLSYEEKRHLNAASLPDSVWSRDIYSGSSIDTNIQKLAYNANGNPLYLRDFIPGSVTPEYEIRWYYQSQSGVGVTGGTATNNLLVYPNPAKDILYVKGGADGRYNILNMAGQVVQSGTLQTAGLPVSALVPGVYSLGIQGKDGIVRTTQFTRQ